MSIACEKNITIKVVNPDIDPTAYWTLDEATANTNRADSVGSCDMIYSAPAGPGVPALFSNGVEFDWVT